MKKNTLVLIVIALLLVFLLTSPIIMEVFDISFSNDETAVEIVIPAGATVKDIAHILKENDLIKNESVFVLKVKMSKYKNSLNYGAFSIKKSMTIKEIITILGETHYKRDTFTVTFPEGSSLEQMADILSKKGIDKNDFFNAVKESYDYEFLKNIPKGEYNYFLQGFLFPDTYEFYTDSSARDIVDTLLKEFEKKYLSVTGDFSDVFEVITKASVIEKEAKLDAERPMVAGVIENRLKKDMLLQIDACVVYAVTDGMYDIDTVYKSHLNTTSLYNTYKYKGLPPGPICNPGITSIKAALEPKEHDYLYYHTDEKKGDGSHIFTKTLDEHIKTME